MKSRLRPKIFQRTDVACASPVPESANEMALMRAYRLAFLAAILLAPTIPICAGENDATVILDKAIKALGGEEKLRKIEAFSWNFTGYRKDGGRVTQVTMDATFSGLDRVRRAIGTKPLYNVTIVDGDKGWQQFRVQVHPIDAEGLVAEKRNIYLQVVPTLLVPLKSHAFKVEYSGEEPVNEKPAFVLKVTGPEGKNFLLYFDKDTFLPVKEIARSVGADGKEKTEETKFGAYKELGGIKKATAVEIRSGPESVILLELTSFQVLDRVAPTTFSAPR